MTFKKWLSALLAGVMLCTMVPVALMEDIDDADVASEVLEESFEETTIELGEEGEVVEENSFELIPEGLFEDEPEVEDVADDFDEVEPNAIEKVDAEDDLWKVEAGVVKKYKGETIPADVVFPDSVTDKTDATKVATVLGIAADVFATKTGISSVAIPQKVKEIQEGAFEGFTALATVTFADGSYLETIGANAFKDTALTAITLPSRVKAVPAGCFEGCAALATANLANATTIGATAFKGTALTALAQGKITSIGASAFESAKLKELTLKGCTIDATSFKGCADLATVTLTDVTVPAAAFKDLAGLTTLTIKGGSFQSDSFEGCAALKKVVLEDVDVPANAFKGIATLTELAVEDVGSIGANAFEGCGMDYVDLSGAEEVADGAFNKCASLTGVLVLGDQVPSAIFTECAALTKVSVDEDDESDKLADNFLKGMATVTTVEIPESVWLIGTNAFDGCTGLTALPELENEDVIIGANAFANCGFTTVTIPENFVSFGDAPFKGCTSLATITVNYGPDAEYNPDDLKKDTGATPETVVTVAGMKKIPDNYKKGDTELTEIVIPDGVTVIGNYAYAGCSKATKITIPATVTEIGQNAFDGCSGVTELTIPEGVKRIGNNAFKDMNITAVSIPKSVTSFGEAPFAGCELLATITVNIGGKVYYGYTYENLTKGTYVNEFVIAKGSECIPSGFFANQTDLGADALKIPATVTQIGSCAFQNCAALTAIDLSNVDSIGWRAFQGCTGLTEVDLSSATSIDEEAFDGCTGITKATLRTDGYNTLNGLFGDGNKIEEVTAAKGSEYVKDEMFSGAENLKKATLCEGIKRIKEYAFSGCKALTEVNIPATVKTIEGEAFAGCEKLATLAIPEGVKRIWGGAFAETGLTELALPSTLDYTDEEEPEDGSWLPNLFWGECEKLQKVDLSACEKLTAIGEDALSFLPALAEVKLPATVTELGPWAFDGDEKLTTIEGLDNVKKIGERAPSGIGMETIELRNKEVEIAPKAIDQKTTIKCYVGSTAEAYGKKYQNKVVYFDPINLVTVDPLPEDQKTLPYTGDPVTPAFKITEGDKLLVEGTDYELAYEPNNIDVGQVTLVVKGKGEYAGEKDTDVKRVENAFEIVSNASALTIELVGGDAQDYTGYEVEPEVIVKQPDGTKMDKSNFKVTYENNIEPGEGTAIAKIDILAGTYKGPVTKKFSIVVGKFILKAKGANKAIWSDKARMQLALEETGVTVESVTSSKPAVATVDPSTLVVTCKAPGKTVIKVKLSNKKTRKLNLTVVNPTWVTKLKMADMTGALVKGTKKIAVGETLKVKPAVEPLTAKKDLTFDLGKKGGQFVDVAYDEATGAYVITGKAKGTAKITFSAVSKDPKKKIKATVSVKVLG